MGTAHSGVPGAGKQGQPVPGGAETEVQLRLSSRLLHPCPEREKSRAGTAEVAGVCKPGPGGGGAGQPDFRAHGAGGRRDGRAGDGEAEGGEGVQRTDRPAHRRQFAVLRPDEGCQCHPGADGAEHRQRYRRFSVSDGHVRAGFPCGLAGPRRGRAAGHKRRNQRLP